MIIETARSRLARAIPWNPITEIPDSTSMPPSDMPGDKRLIRAAHLQKANCIIPSLLALLINVLDENKHERAVVSICGVSGVGKTETAAVIAYGLQMSGVKAYVLSGDNYPHRIPVYNDAERLSIFRIEGIRELIARGIYTEERRVVLAGLQKSGDDADWRQTEANPWLAVYQYGGDNGLRKYLGTQQEIDFVELSGIISQFKNGADKVFLKRMGREEGTTWYEAVDFRNIDILIVEWTHGNNDNLRGIDIPVLLYSTPEETLAHRQARGRDRGADSPFVARTLGIEAELILSQAHRAKIIISNQCEQITFKELSELSRREDTK